METRTLFADSPTGTNLLPQDGEVYYFGQLFGAQQADQFLTALLETTDWQHDELVLFGKHITTARRMAWVGDDRFAYTYSNSTRVATQWTAELLEIKDAVEDKAQTKFNSCLLNLYDDGSQGMSWHQDDEKELGGSQTTIASVSFGATRRFDFRHIATQQKVQVYLEHGSLLIMRGATQQFWQHQLPKTKKVTNPRINLTFRTYVGQPG